MPIGELYGETDLGRLAVAADANWEPNREAGLASWQLQRMPIGSRTERAGLANWQRQRMPIGGATAAPTPTAKRAYRSTPRSAARAAW